MYLIDKFFYIIKAKLILDSNSSVLNISCKSKYISSFQYDVIFSFIFYNLKFLI